MHQFPWMLPKQLFVLFASGFPQYVSRLLEKGWTMLGIVLRSLALAPNGGFRCAKSPRSKQKRGLCRRETFAHAAGRQMFRQRMDWRALMMD